MDAPPRVEVSPALFGGEPTVHGYPTQLIADLYDEGKDVETLYRLSRHEMIVALWYEARHGKRFQHWEEWRRWIEAEMRLKRQPVEELPLPATRRT